MKNILNQPIQNVLKVYPYSSDFFIGCGLLDLNLIPEQTISDYIMNIDEFTLLDVGISRENIGQSFILFLEKMEKLKGKKHSLNSITILGGRNKSGEKELVSFTIHKGEVISILGPTGSGKSRLLADIECIAQGDTQTRRTILLDGRNPNFNERFKIENKLISQLSQNMNFVMDLSVREFLQLHGESRMIPNIKEAIDEIYTCANELAGERFLYETQLTELSGGQSRALMIADTAFLSLSPIVLIDEIENAGVDRKKAVNLLTSKEKIVLISTHDPILALIGDKRIIIENGGIKKVISTNSSEKELLVDLELVDKKIKRIQNLLRTGKELNFNKF